MFIPPPPNFIHIQSSLNTDKAKFKKFLERKQVTMLVLLNFDPVGTQSTSTSELRSL